MKKTIVTVAALRPDLIRLFSTIEKLDASKYNHYLIATNQQYNYNRFDLFLDELNIRQPDIRLSSGAPGRSAWEQIYICGAQLTEALEKLPNKPDLLLYLGDSNSCASIFQMKRVGYKIARVEALMRAFSSIQEMSMLGGCLLPECLNRRVADSMADVLFTYHDDYREHARREGIPLDRVFTVGNTIVEAVRRTADLSYVGKKEYIAVDLHRQQSRESREHISFCLETVKKYSEIFNIPIKMLDFNTTTEAIRKFGLSLDGIDLVPLMGYKDYLRFQQDSLFVFSNSGSAAEETPLLGIPNICPRNETERPQSFTKENNCAFLLKDNWECFDQSAEWLKNWRKEDIRTEWLGSGNTSNLILQYLEQTDGVFW